MKSFYSDEIPNNGFSSTHAWNLNHGKGWYVLSMSSMLGYFCCVNDFGDLVISPGDPCLFLCMFYEEDSALQEW